MTRPLRIAVIGAGPSGFYATEALLKQTQYDVTVDLIDRLPTPYGLVRYGVAPDHQKIKSVTNIFQKIAANPKVRFLGNVNFGTDITYDDLKAHYDAIFYTVGASSDRSLGIPGENLLGSMSATEFVAWYNGHPDYADRTMPLDIEGVAVVGVGNVAVDVSRILAKTAEELALTDTADHAIEQLKHSKVKDIYVLGRRGAAQAKFTTKELREFGELLNADVVVDPAEVQVDELSAKEMENPGTAKNVEVLQHFSEKPLEGKPRRVHLRFLVSPVEIIGTDRVEGLKIEKNKLVEQDGWVAAVGTGEFETLNVGMVLRSVGYKGVALPGVAFDARKGVIPNEGGRVKTENGVVPGEYTAGWIKRGPSGVVGTNKACAVDSVNLFLEDAATLPKADDANATPEAVDALLAARGARVVTFQDWLELDRHETEKGKAQGRPRVKFATVQDMLSALETVKG
ncbi:FAD-dependent oxidoreductase [Deinococcus roseus]|uniref:NADP oxidoreductase n=1 Tax=Deinococcus roseus TaxID=392414 RepID=A0ABQ2D269_9DEIO|nr:FAD-dependent oxidoreductase [Deinococcus roseus]GGJ40630.1 NADP oxidoreductase [Deinococcus roseus]